MHEKNYTKPQSIDDNYRNKIFYGFKKEREIRPVTGQNKER